ncbi:hypothetical protein [Helicobacter fennelliae]|uniref:Uncharacterized protein n=2 Tax=Campylobacterales TaxID=213849 RepID=T1DUP6_9HELI|nr:hypothetical protein [Helicobacter fennelliae]GAD17827.1 hypothetical protein HFN_0642 [Helicobacter fennelliae MRY12-0050]STP07379.1 Uncharacterised protein [Helicobacter fennelliae]STQ92042.1 Uncharacterised protein [Helicobacter fennelliae]
MNYKNKETLIQSFNGNIDQVYFSHLNKKAKIQFLADKNEKLDKEVDKFSGALKLNICGALNLIERLTKILKKEFKKRDKKVFKEFSKKLKAQQRLNINEEVLNKVEIPDREILHYFADLHFIIDRLEQSNTNKTRRMK